MPSLATRYPMTESQDSQMYTISLEVCLDPFHAKLNYTCHAQRMLIFVNFSIPIGSTPPSNVGRY